MSETNIMIGQLLALSKAGVTAWRLNTGMGWAGKAKRIMRRQTVALNPGDVVISNARPLHAGLCKGGADIIGITPVMIQPHHVGQVFGLFTAIESKAKTKPTTEQINFIDHINNAGGLAGVARSDDEAIAIVDRHRIARTHK